MYGCLVRPPCFLVCGRLRPASADGNVAELNNHNTNAGKYGWQNLPFMYERIRVQDFPRCVSCLLYIYILPLPHHVV